MRVLALDSTTRAGSVAVVEDDRIVVERTGDPLRTHAERLPGEMLDLGVPLSSVDLFAVACGPGSFTGLRVGIAAIQGLASVRRTRVAAVSALEALAHLGGRELGRGSIVGAWMDAHRREVFSALYRLEGGDRFADSSLIELEGPAVGDPASTLTRWIAAGSTPDVIVGDGAELYAAIVGTRARVTPAPAVAGAIGLIAVHRARAGRTVDPAGVRPLYIRRPDAEIARERGAARGR